MKRFNASGNSAFCAGCHEAEDEAIQDSVRNCEGTRGEVYICTGGAGLLSTARGCFAPFCATELPKTSCLLYVHGTRHVRGTEPI